MSSSIRTKDWGALDKADSIATNGRHLVVSGEVEVSDTSKRPRLTEASPQGINNNILILDLAVDSSGIGEQTMGWAKAEFTKAVSTRGQYHEVSIRNGSETVGSAKVHFQDS